MNWFIAIALSLSLGGSIAAPVGTILLKGYREERKRVLQGGGNPHTLPRTEQIHEPSLAAKKHRGLLLSTTPMVESPTALTDDGLPLTQDTRSPVPSLSSSAPKNTRSAYTLILENPLECRAVFGAQRTGKSYFLAVASQELHRQGMKIYQINLGNYGTEEDSYWCHCTRSVRGDISAMRAYEAKQLIEEAIAVVDEFYSQEDAILIFDEWIYAGKKNNAHSKALQPLIDLVADRAGILTQTGVKRSKAIWTVAPEFVAGTLIESAKVIKSFSLLYVTIAPHRTLKWVNPRTGKAKPIKFSTSLFEQIGNNYEIEMPTERFAVDRICFIDNEWIEMGKLPPLDPTIRSRSTPQCKPEVRDSADALSNIIEGLRNTHHNTLWEYFTEETGASPDEARTAIGYIAEVIFDSGLSSLQSKFRLQSKWDARYSYKGYREKSARAHRFTDGICCCCREKSSAQAHHTEYLGAEDEPGINLYPVCKPCHDSVCHNSTNWVRGGIWEAHSTEQFTQKLQEGFRQLAS